MIVSNASIDLDIVIVNNLKKIGRKISSKLRQTDLELLLMDFPPKFVEQTWLKALK